MNWWKTAQSNEYEQMKTYFEQNRDSLVNNPAVLNDLKTKGTVSHDTVRQIVKEEGLTNFVTRQLGTIFNGWPLHPLVAEFRKNEKEQQERENVDDYLYHVTTKRNLAKIKRNGLLPGQESIFGGWYAWHSQDKTFLCERGGIGYWTERIEHTEDMNKDKPSQPIVLRIKKDKLQGIQADQPGTTDSRHNSYYVSTPIPNVDIEFV